MQCLEGTVCVCARARARARNTGGVAVLCRGKHGDDCVAAFLSLSPPRSLSLFACALHAYGVYVFCMCGLYVGVGVGVGKC